MSHAANSSSPVGRSTLWARWSRSTCAGLDSIPILGRFPLVVDPLVGTTRLTKALVDEGSYLNLMYLDSFEGLGLT
jgi:hypothetical protein